MGSDSTFDDLVAPLRDDNVSGASELSRTAADSLRRAALRVPAGSLEELRESLAEVGRRVMDAQPSMAPMVTVVREVLEAVERVGRPGRRGSLDAAEGGDESAPDRRGSPDTADRSDDSASDHFVEAGRHAAARAADDFRSSLEARAEAVVEAAVDILPTSGTSPRDTAARGTAAGSTAARSTAAKGAPARGTVGTISASGTVGRLLESQAGPRGLRVVCFESRPMREGRALAEALADAGVAVVHAVDAAIESLVPECDVVIFGTDAVGDAGVTNKIGSTALARAARDAGVPVYVLADETKLLPRGHPQVVGDDRPAGEVWGDAPAGVTVWNRYFEVVPMEWVTGVVTERGVLSAEELGELRVSGDFT